MWNKTTITMKVSLGFQRMCNKYGWEKTYRYDTHQLLRKGFGEASISDWSSRQSRREGHGVVYDSGCENLQYVIVKVGGWWAALGRREWREAWIKEQHFSVSPFMLASH